MVIHGVMTSGGVTIIHDTNVSDGHEMTFRANMATEVIEARHSSTYTVGH